MKNTKDVLFKLNNFPKSWLPDELSDCMQCSSFLPTLERVNVKEFWKNSDYIGPLSLADGLDTKTAVHD